MSTVIESQNLLPWLNEVEIPAEVQEFIEDGRLVFLSRREDGTLEFVCPKHEASECENITLVWHGPNTPWDYEGCRFYLQRELFRDKKNYDPLGPPQLLEPDNIEELILWLENIHD